MDTMVLKTQEWLNKTYGSDSRYNKIPENGRTGWTTIYALTRALQIELGITATADNFGMGTRSKFSAKYPNGIQQQEDNDKSVSNVYAIIQGALWCKGYGTGAGDITLHFYDGTGNAIMRLKRDAYGTALDSSVDSTVTLNVMVALLSMNQYVLLSSLGGTQGIRTIQQSLNSRYEAYVGLMPCDGLYGREMNKALIKVLQAVEGLSPSEANGSFGPTTKARCPIFPPGGSSDAIALFRNALVCNGYLLSAGKDAWDSNLESQVRMFQSDMCLSVTGKADLNTWMSLLLSSGNPDRPATVCDTRFEITEARAEQLKALGYTTVGRYLTGGDFKELRVAEPQRILDKGLTFFPIFQESTTDLSYFTYDRGKVDAVKAAAAARKFGIPNNAVIYFAVDTDVLDGNISSYIIPYFHGVWANLDHKYKVGIYGTRNVSTKVIDAGYAITCFVSDMSTGFSGNMGFKMPSKWNYDQFAEISLNPDWGIDKLGYSGKYPPVSSLDIMTGTSTVSMLDIIDEIHKLELLYKKYHEECFNLSPQTVPLLTSERLALGVTNFLRSIKYADWKWTISLGRGIDQGFVDYVREYNRGLFDWCMKYISSETMDIKDGLDGRIDLAHLAATTEGYIDCFVPEPWTGWAGDLATGMGDTQVALSENNNQNISELANKIIGSETSSCNFVDLCCDADAIRLAELVKQSDSLENPLSSALNKYYSSEYKSRYSYYLRDLDGANNIVAAKEEIYSIMNAGFTLKGDSITVVALLNDKMPAEEVNRACCNAFAEYIFRG